jgi:WD40 repeat protein
VGRHNRRPRGSTTTGGYINDLAFSPDGRAIAVSTGELVLLDPGTLAVTKRIDTGLDSVYSIAYSHDGSRLAAGDDTRTVAFLAMPDGTVTNRVQAPWDTGVFALTFSPDDRTVAFGQQPDTNEATPPLPTVHLADVADARLTGVNFLAHASRRITALAFGADGASWPPRVATSAATPMAKSPSGTREVVNSCSPITDPVEEVSDLALDTSGAGLRVAAADQDGVVVWDLDVGSWQQQVCAIVARDLTPEEWLRHVGAAVPYRRTCTP